MKRTEDELRKALKQQIKFLENSCKAFDVGDESEALRIATVLRVLLHDTPKSASLLKLLGLKDTIEFIDSAEPIDPVQTTSKHDGRTVFAVSGMPGLFAITFTREGSKLVPRLDSGMYARGAVTFDEWWNDGCIPGHGKARHSRSWLIKQMANKEGGAHVDPEITIGYAELKTSTMGMTVNSNGIVGFINSPADVSVRQVAWEVLKSLEQGVLLVKE